MPALDLNLDADLLWKAKALPIIRQCCIIAKMPDVADNIHVIFCSKKRTTMGTAWTHQGPHCTYTKKGATGKPHPLYPLSSKPRGGVIVFNIRLFTRADDKTCIDTIVHEISHILANLKAGDNVGHSEQWQDMMYYVGGPFGVLKVERCHSVNTIGLERRNRRFLLECPSSRCRWNCSITAALRTRRMNEIKRGAGYVCPKCDTDLLLRDYEKAKEIR
jgi:predicted SprT family Zn-dependent metalloprotease